MSSSKNINQPLQAAVTTNNLTDYANPRQGPSTTSNAIRVQRSSHEPNTSSRSRSGRSGRGGGKHTGVFNRANNGSHRDSEVLPQHGLAIMEKHPEEDSTQVVDAEAIDMSTSTIRVHKQSDNRVGHGKYRQRQHTSRMLDGIAPLDGLDIDLAESIVPTDQIVARSGETSKNRHATNNRKVNLTHLLNYKFESKHRGTRYQSSSTSHGDGTANQYRHTSSHYRDPGTIHKFSKQQFLQANCQFVVLDGHDYSVHKADPDWPVDWNCIEEVRFKQSASTETSCPICLEPPIAAKITRCGHIYCWTCMLHYLSLSDENCRQCPICFEPVYKSDLRSVISHSYINYSVGDEILMRLMIRKKGCVEVESYKRDVSHTSEVDADQPLPLATSNYLLSQANLVIVDPSTVIIKITQRERNDLLAKLETDRNEPEVCFIEQAIGLLEKRVEKLDSQVMIASNTKTQDIGSKTPSTLSKPDFSKSYLFYQCSDGQHIYLNPFSTKTLCHEHENLENCPLELRAKILQMDWISMSDAWRKRFRYLEHLPLTCEFRLIEIDFEGTGLISNETYKVFEDQIKRREQERVRRRREERKREKIIQVEQNRKIYGIQPSLKINLNNIDQFPSVSDERYLGLTQPRNQSKINEGLSSDEDLDEPGEDSQEDPTQRSPPKRDEAENNSPPDVLTEVAMSFKDIQLQQQATSATNSAKAGTTPNKTSAWLGKKQSCSSSQSASFANLLLDAKTSQKEWTRNVSSSSTAVDARYKQGPIAQAPGSDDGVEELRAPPCEFTISDFIDMNVVSNSKKKGKAKRLTKK